MTHGLRIQAALRTGAIAILATAGCSDATGPTPLFGTYSLTTVNAKRLPVTIDDPDTSCATQFAQGTVTVGADSTLRVSIQGAQTSATCWLPQTALSFQLDTRWYQFSGDTLWLSFATPQLAPDCGYGMRFFAIKSGNNLEFDFQICPPFQRHDAFIFSR